jgi:hypothetical protein
MSLKNWTWSFDPFPTLVVALAPTAISTGQADKPILLRSGRQMD